MTLDEAYDALGLKPPWEWEERVRGRHAENYGNRVEAYTGQYDRRIGSTQHMLIELYLDLEKANRTVPLSDRGKVKFVIVVMNAHYGRSLLEQLGYLHEKLNRYVDLSQIELVIHNRATMIRGKRWASWGIFTDHSVKEQVWGQDRPTGPWRYIRSIVPAMDGSQFDCFDRDGNFICTVLGTEVNPILEAAECPIKFTADLAKVNDAVSYPAWSDSEFQHAVFYKKQWEVVE